MSIHNQKVKEEKDSWLSSLKQVYRVAENWLITAFLFSLPFQLGKHFWPPTSFVYGLKVDYYSPAFYLQDALFIFLLIGYLFLEKNKGLSKQQISIIVLSLIFVAINLYFSISPLRSLFFWLRASQLLICTCLLKRKVAIIWPKLKTVVPLWIFLEGFICFWQILTNHSVGGIFWLLGERTFNVSTLGVAKITFLGNLFLRPYGTFSHPNSLAGFFLIAFIFLLFGKKEKTIEKIALVLCFLLIALAFSQTVYLFLFALLVFVFINRLRKFNFSSVFLLGSLLTLLWLFWQKGIGDSPFSIRMALNRFALELIVKKPFFGVGAGNFISALASKGVIYDGIYWLQPVHNIFLFVASETGLIGLIVFVAFLLLTIKNLFRQRSFSSFYLLFSIFGILFTGLFDHYWLTLIQNQLLFALVLALCWGVDGVKLGNGAKTRGFFKHTRPDC